MFTSGARAAEPAGGQNQAHLKDKSRTRQSLACVAVALSGAARGTLRREGHAALTRAQAVRRPGSTRERTTRRARCILLQRPALWPFGHCLRVELPGPLTARRW